MAIDIEGTCDVVQTIVAGSTLIRQAPPIAEWPEAIDDADMPLALTRPGQADWGSPTMGETSRKGRYITDIYVMAPTQGLIHEGIAQTLDIITSVGALLSAATNLGSVAGMQKVRDRGLVILKYGASEYRGTTFEIDVEEDV